MIAGRTVSLVMPCYNEEEGVRRVIEALPDGIDEIIVVDNNCTDRTAEVAASLGATVVAETRRGYGAAYKAGMAAATQDIIVTMDADATYPTGSIPSLVETLVNDRLDFISGCRFPLADGESMPITNQIGNMVLTMATAVLFLKPVRDSQSGMWVFHRTLLPRLRVESDGMPFSEEIKIEAMRKRDVRFHEIHIPYHDRVGEVKLARWRDGLHNLFYLLRLRFRG